MLTMLGGFFPFTRFCSAICPPKVVCVPAPEASTIAAPGADALAHSASSAASPSSPFATPGSLQLFAPLAGAGCTVVRLPDVYCDNPNTDRNAVQSCAV